MTGDTFVYALTIRTTAEALWDALTSNALWQEYWGGEWQIESDWAPGSTVTFRTREGQLFSIGTVVESDRPRRLSYTWPNPEDEQGAHPPEQLTWQIEPEGDDAVRLVLTHEHLTPEFAQGVREGWPKVFADLKAVVERHSGTP